MSGVVFGAGLSFVAIVAALVVALRRLRRHVELEEAERTLAAEDVDVWTRRRRTRR